MAFRGLFIGIDRYASTGIDELTCARRDAVALEALFSDTLGGTTRLLADGDATRAGLKPPSPNWRRAMSTTPS